MSTDATAAMTVDALMKLVNRYAEACDDLGADLFAQDATKHAALHEAASAVYAQIRAALEQYGKEQYARGVNDAWPAGRGSGESAGQVFGIIDPDYARVFTHARIVAWQYGYACLAHGSFTRDLDLLLVPWTGTAKADDVDYFAPRIANAAGLKVQNPPSVRPHGRKTWTLLFPGFADPRWVDLSVLSPTAAQHSGPLTDEQTKALQDVIAERKRQIAVEGWTPEHDDEHAGGDLAEAAACYVLGTADKDTWPWEWEAWKPKDGRRNLVKAAALLLAEIERLDRRSAE